MASVEKAPQYNRENILTEEHKQAYSVKPMCLVSYP